MQIRRALAPRLRGHGRIEVRRRRNHTLTIVHCLDCADGTRPVALPVAQLRFVDAGIHLFRRRGNGRWVPYSTSAGNFRGNLAECLAEVSADRWGCFWA